MAIDWTGSMKQSFEFYEVDINTWGDKTKLDCFESASIDRDSSSTTLGSATIECSEAVKECYVRIYLIAIQNGETTKEPLGTFLVQTPSDSFNGKRHTYSLDAYTPLIELKGDCPPIGYSILTGESIMTRASTICSENMRAPITSTISTTAIQYDFVANLDDTWLTYVSDLIATANYQFDIDAMGNVMFAPVQDAAALRPVWTYDDDNSSILYPDIEDERDLYNVPNVVEVVYSTEAGYMYATATNDDPSSEISTVSRGRTVLYRDSNPSFSGVPSQTEMNDYAISLLKSLSCLEHTVTYTHGYCPVRVGDGVLLNYKRAGLSYVKAKVISQSIKCEVGCSVEETAVYTTQLWG
ncbi:MAG: hypothetical protein LUF78_10860 [Clostridiales bacterium]|nr:hypothetical protein [Clostridiales bacterium]